MEPRVLAPVSFDFKERLFYGSSKRMQEASYGLCFMVQLALPLA